MSQPPRSPPRPQRRADLQPSPARTPRTARIASSVRIAIPADDGGSQRERASSSGPSGSANADADAADPSATEAASRRKHASAHEDERVDAAHSQPRQGGLWSAVRATVAAAAQLRSPPRGRAPGDAAGKGGEAGEGGAHDDGEDDDDLRVDDDGLSPSLDGYGHGREPRSRFSSFVSAQEQAEEHGGGGGGGGGGGSGSADSPSSSSRKHKQKHKHKHVQSPQEAAQREREHVQRILRLRRNRWSLALGAGEAAGGADAAPDLARSASASASGFAAGKSSSKGASSSGFSAPGAASSSRRLRREGSSAFATSLTPHGASDGERGSDSDSDGGGTRRGSARMSRAATASAAGRPGSVTMPRHGAHWQSIAHLLEDRPPLSASSSARRSLSRSRSRFTGRTQSRAGTTRAKSAEPSEHADAASSAIERSNATWHHDEQREQGSADGDSDGDGAGAAPSADPLPQWRGAFSPPEWGKGLENDFLISPPPSPDKDESAEGQGSEETAQDEGEGAAPRATDQKQQGRDVLTAEPVSYVDLPTPSAIPALEDPLAYFPASDAKRLLDEADAEEALLERHEQRRRLAEQEASRTAERGPLYRALAWARRHAAPYTHSLRLSPVQRGIIKCTIAYLIASLCTFSPWLSTRLAMLLPNHDPDKKVPISNLHMIATVAVYFHPAKTLGAMLEADAYAALGFVYALGLTILSMGLAVFLHDHDQAALSSVLVVTLFIGGGMGALAWAKVQMANPSFNTACSMVGIIVFTVMIKEGAAHLGRFSTDKIWQVTICVVAGVLISNAVCLAVRPQRATTALQADVRRNLSGFAVLLKALTKTFLLDDPRRFHLESERIRRAIDDHHASFVSLKKNLADAQRERWAGDARMRGAETAAAYADAVGSMNRLAQHLAGLRSSCGLQQRVITQRQTKARGDVQADPFADHEDTDGSGSDDGGQWKARGDPFGDFVQHIGPHMRSLVFTSSRALRNLRSAFLTIGDVALPSEEGDKLQNDGDYGAMGDARRSYHYVPGSSFDLLAEDVRVALERFRLEQSVSIRRIYEDTLYDEGRTGEQLEAAALAARTLSGEDMMPEEQVFLVFFFVFNLEEFAKELVHLANALETIRQHEEHIARRRALPPRKRLFAMAKATLSSLFSWGESERRRRQRTRTATNDSNSTFPDFRPHQANTAHTPAADSATMRLSRIIWSVGRWLRRTDVKFAIKTGAGAALLAAPAFIHNTRPMYTDYQGQWALVSYMVVMSPTVGQSNQMSLQRIAGTMLGAAAAYLAYHLFPDNNIALPVFGALFSIPCFWAIVGKPQHASAGRFVLLTYNLTALYSYNLRKLDIEVEQIAIKRTISVIAGVTWATLLTHLIWPMEARRQLTEGMADLMFRLSFLYQKLVLSYSTEPSRAGTAIEQDDSEDSDGTEGERRALLATADGFRHRDRFQPLELQLQVAIIKLEGLLAQTRHEPRLKGPFPIAKYKAMLNSCQSILDRLHSMRCVTSREAWYRSVRRDFVIPVNPYRREMVGNVLLFFYILGTAFHLKAPLPPYLPPAGAARAALLARIRELPVVRKRQVRGGSHFLLFYSYALAMKQVIEQLETLGRLAQDNFGVLGGDVDAFERQFTHEPASGHASGAPTPRDSSAGELVAHVRD